MHVSRKSLQALLAMVLAASVSPLMSAQQKPSGCEQLPDHAALKAALQKIQKLGKEANSGLGNHMWAVLVNRDGIVCAVAFSGQDRSAQWPGSRLIAAEKANTANALSLPNFALSTANIYAASQPGQSLYSLATMGPPNPQAAFAGPATQFGQPNDPMVGKPIGGVIVFAGGLALYQSKGKILGGLGVSGDTSCADHIIAWKVRHELKLDFVPLGVAPGQNDNIILDFQNGNSASGFGHPTCRGGIPPEEALKKLTQDFPTGGK